MAGFELQKLVMVALCPLGFAILLALLGLALKRRSVVLLALIWLYAWSTPRAAELLGAAVGRGYPIRPVAELPAADLILVLGGGLSPGSIGLRTEANVGDAADRLFLAAQLYQMHKAEHLLYSGGPTSWGNSEAQAGAALLQRLGVPAGAIAVEPDSRTTRENAELSLPLIAKSGAHRILFVTSQWHLRRALLTFEQAAAKQGLALDFIPAPCDPTHLPDDEDRIRRWLPSGPAIEVSQRMFKELIGLAYMRLFGG